MTYIIQTPCNAPRPFFSSPQLPNCYPQMDNAIFNEITESLKQAVAIKRGELAPGRRFTVTAPDAKLVRETTGLSQSEFAALLRISIDTLQNWEQHRRVPRGPAAALLKLVQASPEFVLKTLHA